MGSENGHIGLVILSHIFVVAKLVELPVREPLKKDTEVPDIGSGQEIPDTGAFMQRDISLCMFFPQADNHAKATYKRLVSHVFPPKHGKSVSISEPGHIDDEPQDLTHLRDQSGILRLGVPFEISSQAFSVGGTEHRRWDGRVLSGELERQFG
jgi:hypothetical protein